LDGRKPPVVGGFERKRKVKQSQRNLSKIKFEKTIPND